MAQAHVASVHQLDLLIQEFAVHRMKFRTAAPARGWTLMKRGIDRYLERWRTMFSDEGPSQDFVETLMPLSGLS